MAVKDVPKLLFAIQSHPELIFPEPLELHIVINWWRASIAWLSTNPRPNVDTACKIGHDQCIKLNQKMVDGDHVSQDNPSCSLTSMGPQGSPSYSSAA